ncbi:MAG: hypothetical protein CTR53_18455 [Ferrovibrio sp.]|nr:MAG: hypothetical protein CTR53_18455 [Ferrovibrio sp.]
MKEWKEKPTKPSSDFWAQRPLSFVCQRQFKQEPSRIMQMRKIVIKKQILSTLLAALGTGEIKKPNSFSSLLRSIHRPN